MCHKYLEFPTYLFCVSLRQFLLVLFSDFSPFENGDLEMTDGFATSNTSKPMPVVCLNLKLCQVLPYKDIKRGC